jgi:hypothetical protein
MGNYLDKFSAQNPQSKVDPRYVWWLEAPKAEDDDEFVEQARASSLISCAQILENAQAEVHQQNLWSAQLYSNRELAAFDWGTGNLYKASLAPISRTGENITVRVVDTMVSQIGKNRPKPKPTARGASFGLRRQIRLLDKFLYGEFMRNRVYATGKACFRDACIFGVGCVKVSLDESEEHGAQICYERVFPDEILVDQMEMVACGKIRHFYRRRVLPIEVIAATYDVDEDELRELATSQASTSYNPDRPIGAGWLVVVEGYQLGTAKSPGRWMVAVNNKVLNEGEWPHDWLPYVFYHYQMPVSGFYSSGVVEQALPYQIRLNEINEVIRDAQDLMGRPRILIAEGSRVNPLDLDNVIGRFIKYTGIKPEAITWPAISAELYNERDRLVRTCMEHFGLSNMATTVTPPPGARFDSSPAFREFNAIQDDRLSDPAQRFEELYLTLAERTVQVIEASGSNPKTTWYSGYKQSKAEVIEWGEINHDASTYVMTMEATSLYSMSPAAARDELEKQLAMGLITPEQYRMELCDPDQESEYTIQAAAAEDLSRVQELLECGDFEEPTPEQDLVNGVQRMTLALLNLSKYKDDERSKVKLEDVKLAFINWITLAKAILKKGTEPTAATAASLPPTDPNAMPGLPPIGAQPQPQFAGPEGVSVPEAAGLATAQPGRAPRING